MENLKEKQEEILAQDILRKVNHKMKLMQIAKDKKQIRFFISLFIVCIVMISFSLIYPRFYNNGFNIIFLFMPLLFEHIAILNKRLDAIIELIEIMEEKDNKIASGDPEQRCDFSKD